MEDLLKDFKSKKIDVNCGTGAMFRGVVENVDNDILKLIDENEAVIYISIKRITAITEHVETAIRPGFIG